MTGLLLSSPSPRALFAAAAAVATTIIIMPQSAAAFSVGGTFLSAAEKARLEATAAAVATPGKGITACDEGPATIGARFEAVGIQNGEETRRRYRQMLFTAPGCQDYLSAAILDPETLYQRADDGRPFAQLLSDSGIVPGVKPHLKVYALPGTGGDTVMQGLDSLGARCREYYEAGARFAKWRSPLAIDVARGCPTDLAIRANMHDLARFVSFD
jgi:fructose-bisphosphate aldolase class I